MRRFTILLLEPFDVFRGIGVFDTDRGTNKPAPIDDRVAPSMVTLACVARLNHCFHVLKIRPIQAFRFVLSGQLALFA